LIIGVTPATLLRILEQAHQARALSLATLRTLESAILEGTNADGQWNFYQRTSV
jgi:hypothetical protein